MNRELCRHARSRSKSPGAVPVSTAATLTRDEGEDLILRAYMSEDFREEWTPSFNKARDGKANSPYIASPPNKQRVVKS